MTPDRLVTARQVHGVTTLAVRRAVGDLAAPEADAVVTDRPGLLLGVLTADCGPVLLADPEAGIVGAVHAGWKGALGGVIECRSCRHGAAGRGAGPDHGRHRPVHRPGVLRGRPGVRRAFCVRGRPQQRVLRPRHRQGTASTWPATWRRGCGGPVLAKSTGSPAIPAPRRIFSSAFAARPGAARGGLGCSCRPSS